MHGPSGAMPCHNLIWRSQPCQQSMAFSIPAVHPISASLEKTCLPSNLLLLSQTYCMPASLQILFVWDFNSSSLRPSSIYTSLPPLKPRVGWRVTWRLGTWRGERAEQQLHPCHWFHLRLTGRRRALFPNSSRSVSRSTEIEALH